MQQNSVCEWMHSYAHAVRDRRVQTRLTMSALGWWVETGIGGDEDYLVSPSISLCCFTSYYEHHINFIILKCIFKKKILAFIMGSRVVVFPDIHP